MLNFSWAVRNKYIVIKNSYQISKLIFDYVLDRIEEENPDHVVFRNRSRYSLKMELAVHNFLYNINYKRDHTIDTNFESSESFWNRAAFAIIGPIFWLMIK